MNDRQAPVVLAPALAAVVLVTLALAGLLSGVVAHGLIGSLMGATPPPTLSATGLSSPASRTPSTSALATATGVPPSSAFVLELSAAPQHVSPGATLVLLAVATAKGSGKAVANLLCTLGTKPGSAPLVTPWPPAAATDVLGRVIWRITVPGIPAGRYDIQVSAHGTHQYSYWAYATVYVAS